MANCPSCGAALPASAAFCDMCGSGVHVAAQQTSTAHEAAAAAPATPAEASGSQAIFTPNAEVAVRKVTQQARGIATTLGPEKTVAIAGGVFGVLGALLPFYSLGALVYIGAVYDAPSPLPTPSLVNQGMIGAIVILLAIVLALGPFITVRTRATSMIGFGFACSVVGMLLGDYYQSFLFGRSFEAGFNSALLGFGLLTYVYAVRLYQSAA